jgi:hypothetical protein
MRQLTAPHDTRLTFGTVTGKGNEFKPKIWYCDSCDERPAASERPPPDRTEVAIAVNLSVFLILLVLSVLVLRVRKMRLAGGGTRASEPRIFHVKNPSNQSLSGNITIKSLFSNSCR